MNLSSEKLNNNTNDWKDDKMTTGAIVQMVLLGVTINFGSLFNLAVLVVIIINAQLKTIRNLYVFSMAVADFCRCVLVMPFSLAFMINGPLLSQNMFICNYSAFMTSYFIKVSMYCVTSLAMVQYLAICRRRYPPTTIRITRLIIAACWVVPLPQMILLLFLGTSYFPMRHSCGFLSNTSSDFKTIYINIDIIITFVLPFVANVYYFWKIFKRTRKSHKQVGSLQFFSNSKLIVEIKTYTCYTTTMLVGIHLVASSFAIMVRYLAIATGAKPYHRFIFLFTQCFCRLTTVIKNHVFSVCGVDIF
jgi:hypothetical protein